MVEKNKGLQAFDLTTNMAHMVDLDLFDLMKDQRLKLSEMGQIIENCKCCGAHEGCKAWLALNAGGNEIADFCPNAKVYERLKTMTATVEGATEA